MKEKLKKGLIGASSLFVIGHIIYFIGVWYSQEIAVSWSRAYKASSWSTTPEKVDAVSSFFSFFGFSFVVIAILMLAIIFYKWLEYKES